MERDLRNSEGYAEPVPYQARKRKFMPVVYVCSPYADDPEGNTARAKRYSRYALDHGCIPLAPHLLLPQFMDESERDLAMFIDMVLLGKCKKLWVFGNRVSAGMQEEIDRAEKKGMPVRYIAEEDLCTR